MKHREREKKEEFVLVYFFFRAKVKKRRFLDTNFSLSKRTLNVLYYEYVSINLSHTQINSINTHIILNHNARNCSFIIIFNLPHDE